MSLKLAIICHKCHTHAWIGEYHDNIAYLWAGVPTRMASLRQFLDEHVDHETSIGSEAEVYNRSVLEHESTDTIGSLNSETTFDYGVALRFMKRGHKVRRQSWPASHYLCIDKDGVIRTCESATTNGVTIWDEWAFLDEDVLSDDWEIAWVPFTFMESLPLLKAGLKIKRVNTTVSSYLMINELGRFEIHAFSDPDDKEPIPWVPTLPDLEGTGGLWELIRE